MNEFLTESVELVVGRFDNLEMSLTKLYVGLPIVITTGQKG